MRYGEVPLPRVVTVDSAAGLGISRSTVETELRRGRWRRLARGAYLTRPERPVRHDWVAAGLALGGPGALLSGWDAVRAVGLGAEHPPNDDVLVLLPGERHHRARAGQVRFRPSHREVRSRPLAGMPARRTAGVARAVCDTALDYRQLSPVRALVTSAVQRRLCTPIGLHYEFESGPRQRSALLRRAVLDVLGGAESVAEADLVDVLRGADLPPFELNVPILDPTGRHIATGDVVWRTLRAVLEVDSRAHHFFEDDWEATMRRHNELSAWGLSLLHVPPRRTRDDPVSVLSEVQRWLRGRAIELGLPWPPPSGPCDRRPWRLTAR